VGRKASNVPQSARGRRVSDLYCDDGSWDEIKGRLTWTPSRTFSMKRSVPFRTQRFTYWPASSSCGGKLPAAGAAGRPGAFAGR